LCQIANNLQFRSFWLQPSFLPKRLRWVYLTELFSLACIFLPDIPSVHDQGKKSVEDIDRLVLSDFGILQKNINTKKSYGKREKRKRLPALEQLAGLPEAQINKKT
jgi:hypothetical protein